IDIRLSGCGEQVSGGRVRARSGARSIYSYRYRRHVRMRRHIGYGQRDVLVTGCFTQFYRGQSRASALMNRSAPAQIGQGEGGLSVTSVSGAENGKQCRVLGDRQNLSVAHLVASDREIPREHVN